MAKSNKSKSTGNFNVIFCEKTNDRKVCTDESLKEFNENSPESGDYTIEASFETHEEATDSLPK